MSDFTDRFPRKRKANELDLEDKLPNKLDSCNDNPENFRASEEELKKRRIVRVIRDNDQSKEEAPRGKFIFSGTNSLNTNEITNHATAESEKLNTGINNSNIGTDKCHEKPEVSRPVSVSKSDNNISPNINGNPNSQSGSKRIIEGGVRLVKISLKPQSSEGKDKEILGSSKKDSNFINSENKAAAPHEFQNDISKKLVPTLNLNPFLKSAAQIQETKDLKSTSSSTNNFNPFLATKNLSSVNSEASTFNPFAPKTICSNSTNFQSSSLIKTNPFSSFSSNTNSNPFQTLSSNQSSNQAFGSFSNAKPMFNFNLNQAKENPNWNSDDEEEGGVENPEEEIQIEGKNNSSPNTEHLIKFNPNLVKLLKLSLDDLMVYDFCEKKYKSKGKGDFSIELIKSENKDNNTCSILVVCMYRNSTFMTLFSASIFKGVTNFQAGSKNFKNFVVIQKLLGKNESTGKNENKSAKLVFINENDSKLFAEKFEESVKVLEKNDFSIFPKNEIENGKSSKKR